MAVVHDKKRGKLIGLRVLLCILGAALIALGVIVLRTAWKQRLLVIVAGVLLLGIGVHLKPRSKHGDAGKSWRWSC